MLYLIEKNASGGQTNLDLNNQPNMFNILCFKTRTDLGPLPKSPD
jgi:hypothetical protein